MATTQASRKANSLATASTRKLLSSRVCDLQLQLESSPFYGCVDALYQELEAKGLRLFRPAVYLADEWFSPAGVPAIGMPFYLAHPRLAELERQHMQDVEGGTLSECMKLLRHEAGHCFDHAYQISKTRLWRTTFGDPSQRYKPDTYESDPTSRDFVRHLEHDYAQAHPDEDFAETFAVWLDPTSQWQNTYAQWPGALRKLRYVDQVAASLRESKPKVEKGPHIYQVSRLRRTLESHYEQRLRTVAKERRGHISDPSL